MAQGSKYNEALYDSVNKNPVKESSAGEIFDASLGLVVDTRTISSAFINDVSSEDRPRTKLLGLIESGELPEDYTEGYKVKVQGKGYYVDWDLAAQDANDFYDIEPIRTMSELEEERNAELAMRTKYANDVISRGKGLSSVASEFAGGAVGMITSPPDAALMLLGGAEVYGAKAIGRAMYTAKTAGKQFSYGVLAGAIAEPFVWDWRQEIGEEPTLKETMFNLTASGLLSGTVGGSLAFLKHSFKIDPNIKTREELKNTFKKRGLDDAEAETMTSFYESLSEAPDKFISAKEHIQRIEETRERGNDYENNQPDYEPVYKDADEFEARVKEAFEDPNNTFKDESGNSIIFKDVDESYKAEKTRISEMQECILNG